jgi:hypothetical protein
MSIRQQFEDKVEKLVSNKELLTFDQRKEQVEELTEWYFLLTGKHYRNSFFLDMLGTYLLADTLRDKGVHKVSQTAYPILSYTQQRLRNQRERRVGDENIDFIKLKAVDNHPNTFKVRTQNLEDD